MPSNSLKKHWRAARGLLAGRDEAVRMLIIGGALLFAATAAWAIFFVPMNMDEALPYHALACLDYPYSYLHVFREGCDGRYDRVLFSGFHIAGSYVYVGALSWLLYAPVYFLFHAAAAQYWYGLGFFLLFVFLLSREARDPVAAFFIFIAFFPFIFQFIHDTGPVRFGLLAFPLSAILFRKALAAQGVAIIGYTLLLALVILAAIEDKPFFIYLLPPLGFFCLGCAGRDGGFAHRKLKTILPILFGVVAAGCAILLFSTTRGGHSYIAWLMHEAGDKKYLESLALFFTAMTLLWPSYVHKVFYVDYLSDSNLMAVFSVSALVAYLAVATRRGFVDQPDARRILLFGLSYVSLLIVFLCFRNVWAGHHFIFMWAPLAVLFVDFVAILKPQDKFAIATLYLAANLVALVTATQLPMFSHSLPERRAIFAYFDDPVRAEQAIVNFSSWGGYYIKALYGPRNQLVTYTEPMNERDAQKLLALSRATGRRLYDVCFGPGCGEADLNALFRNRLHFHEVPLGLKEWRVFEGR